LTLVTSPDEIVADLKILTARREDLMADWVRGVNRLRELLAGIFPGLERAFDYSTRSALVLLSGYCTPHAIRDAYAPGLTYYLRENSAWPKGIPSMVDKALAAANEETVALPGEAITAAADHQACSVTARVGSGDQRPRQADHRALRQAVAAVRRWAWLRRPLAMGMSLHNSRLTRRSPRFQPTPPSPTVVGATSSG
jgi:hypothetical protein